MPYQIINSQNVLDLYKSVRNIELTSDLIINTHVPLLEFINCKFNNKVKLEDIDSPNLNISFINCIFLDDVNIGRNRINDLSLIWHFKNNTFTDGFVIEHIEKFFVNISSNEINGICKISGLNHVGERFSFIDNSFTRQPRQVIPKRETSYEICGIKNSIITNGSFNNNTFHMPFGFSNNVLKYNQSYSGHSFNNNIFQKSDFVHTDFGSKSTFVRCDFLGTTLFNNIQNITETDLLFSSCKFTGFTHFGNSEISSLNIEYSTFEKPVSFTEAVVNEVSLSEVKFEKGAYFDDFKISRIHEDNFFNTIKTEKLQGWKRSLRLIKQELLKSDNKIDYNRFRVYEFDAYKQELKVEKNQLKLKINPKSRLFARNRHYAKVTRDLFILKLSDYVSDYGTDWKKALKVTLAFSLVIYTIFFILENWGHSWNFDNTFIFFTGFIRFFILTDFYNPLGEGRSYIENDTWNHMISWFIFIFGKIVIAFGIYEMIQAFRKFKA